MDALASRHLLTLNLDVDFAYIQTIGDTGRGRRRIAPIQGGRFAGDRINGVVLPGGADWVMLRPDGLIMIDVRITLKTDDSALIYCTYQGLFKAAPDALARFARGQPLGEDEYQLRTHVRFETGIAAYGWLNDLLAIGVGRQLSTGPEYKIFEIL
jgi:hypothetical protein